MKEIKPRVTLKCEFDHRDKSEVRTFLQFSDYQASETRLKVDETSNEVNMTSVNFSIKRLLKKTKLVPTIQIEFKPGDKSTKAACFEVFVLSKL